MNQYFFIPDESRAESSGGARSDRPDEESSASSRTPQELLTISSGLVLAIDQFMLGNSQFIERIGRGGDLKSACSETLLSTEQREVVTTFGGLLFDAPCGAYQVIRGPRERLIMLVAQSEYKRAGGEREITELWLDYRSRENLAEQIVGSVAIDTRCVVLADARILGDVETLSRFRELRLERQEKAARDFLREMGAAVRYGFGWRGEELDVFAVSSLVNGAPQSESERDVADSQVFVLQARRQS